MFNKIFLLLLSIGAINCIRQFDSYIRRGHYEISLDVPRGEFLYMVSIRIRGKHRCGGSVISEKYILTAGQCVEGLKSPEFLTVQYGVKHIEENGPNIVKVNRIFHHEQYERNKNDIALLELNDRIYFDNTVSRVQLPMENEIVDPYTRGNISGWGSEKTLQRIEVSTTTDDVCEDRSGRDHRIRTRPYHIWTRVYEGPLSNIGERYSDRGGPLVVDGEQIGVLSWSRRVCSFPFDLIGVYTKVSYYVDWIKNIELSNAYIRP